MKPLYPETMERLIVQLRRDVEMLKRRQSPPPSGSAAWAAQTYTGSDIVVAGSGGHGQFIVSANPNTSSPKKFYTNSTTVFSATQNSDYTSYGIQILQLGHYEIRGQFLIRSFGAGAINIDVNLAEGPGFVSWAGDASIGNILSSTPIYGEDSTHVYLNTIILAQATTGAGGLPVPIVWNVDNFGANSATVAMIGYQVFQLDAVDTSLL